MTCVNVHDAKTNFSKLLKRVREGEEVIIASRGVPVARLCPVAPREKRAPGLLQGRLDDAFFEPLPEEELESWEK
jgi:prevent-host-death family protein